MHRKTDRLSSAEAYLKRAITLWEGSLGSGHATLAAGLNNLGELYLAADRLAEGEPLLRRAIGVQEATIGAGHPHTATTLDNLGVLFLRLQKAPGAEALFRRALAVRESKLGATSQAALESMHHLSGHSDYKAVTPRPNGYWCGSCRFWRRIRGNGRRSLGTCSRNWRPFTSGRIVLRARSAT